MSDLKGQRDVIHRTKANVAEAGANYGTVLIREGGSGGKACSKQLLERVTIRTHAIPYEGIA